MNDQFNTSTVGELVAADFRRAKIFEQFGIDFCCSGRRLLVDACRAAAADPGEVDPRARGASRDRIATSTSTRWPIPRLIDHMVSAHHAYVRSALPLISRHLAKLISVHGANHPELLRVTAYFSLLSTDLQQHMLKEEQVLFPYLRDLAGQVGPAA